MAVSPSKTPVRIAAEIQRRLLPLFLPMYRKARQAQRQSLDQSAQDNALAAELAAQLGGRVHIQADHQHDAIMYWHGPTLRVQHGSVRVEHFPSMSSEQARELAQLLVRWQQRTPAA